MCTSSANSYYVATPSFTVTIPTSISLAYDSGSNTWISSKAITVLGDISTGDAVSVSAPTSLTLHDSASASTTASITWGTNGVRIFNDTEVKAGTTNNIVLSVNNSGLYGGTWSGTLVFTISQSFHTHTYTSAITTPADYGVTGTRTYTCSVCGKTYTEDIPALANRTATVGATYNEDANSIDWILTGLADGSVEIAPANIAQMTGAITIPSYVNGYKVTKIADGSVDAIMDAYNGVPYATAKANGHVKSFQYCTGITSITFPDTLTDTGQWSFINCSGLTSLDLNDSITNIGRYAFFWCQNITTVELSKSLSSIGYCAFYYDYGLTTITIQTNINKIEDYAFADCTGLRNLLIPTSVKQINRYCFFDDPSLVINMQAVDSTGMTLGENWSGTSTVVWGAVCNDGGAHNWVQTGHADPWCTTQGYTSYKCSKCGQEKTDYIAALGHTPNGTWLANGNEGYHYQYCTRCGNWTATEAHSIYSYYPNNVYLTYQCSKCSYHYDVYRVIGANSSPAVAGSDAATGKWDYIETWTLINGSVWVGPNGAPISYGYVGDYSGKQVYQVYNKEAVGLYYTYYAFIPAY